MSKSVHLTCAQRQAQRSRTMRVAAKLETPHDVTNFMQGRCIGDRGSKTSSGLVGGTAGLTSEQRPIFASSDVDASASDLQNQLENLIGPSTVYRRLPTPTITTAASI